MEKGFDVTVRLMVRSSQRPDPYYRVSVGTVTALTVNGTGSNDMSLVHINIDTVNPAETLNQLRFLIEAAKQGW